MMAGKALPVSNKPLVTTLTTAPVPATEYVGGQTNVAVMTDISVVIAALFPRAPMYRNAPEEESVSIMTYANARRSGLEMTVPSTPVHLSTTAQATGAV